MKKKEVKEEHYCHCFEAGDLVSAQNGKLYAILEVDNAMYKFLNLQDSHINTLNAGRIEIKKGTTSSQPCDIFDKWHLLYQK